MASQLIPVATRAVAFVAESVARFENLLADNEYRLNANERRVLASLQQRTVEIRTRLYRRVQALIHAIDANARLALARNTIEATPIYSSLVELHRDLRHLPVPDLRSESGVFLQNAWRPASLLAGTDGQPSLHLSHDLIHGQHNVTQGPAVIDLPKLDYATPLTWPLIAHEIAHSVLPAVDVPRHLSQTVSNWLVEAGCDRLAYRICGPAYLAAFAFRTFVDRTYSGGTNKHPPGKLRLKAFTDIRPDAGRRDDLRDTLLRLVAARELASTTGGVKLQEAGLRVLHCQSCKKPFSEVQTDEAERLFSQVLPEYLANLDAQIRNVPLASPNSRHTKSLAQHLKRRMLIGASHDERRAAIEQQALSKLLTHSDRIPSARAVAQLAKTVKYLEDSPNEILDIITAGWRAYLESLSDEAFQDLVTASNDDDAKAWDRYRVAVRNADELLLASIETAHFQSVITSGAPDVTQ